MIPTAEQYRNPAALAIGTHPSQAQIGFHSCGRADYYLSHDWAPRRSPRDTTWSLLVGTTRRGLLVARTKVDVDTPSATRPSSRPATWSP